MKLDDEVCDQARLARDARFDGRFFIAVLSTGIYCRPICPSPTSRRRNVRFFDSAAAAVEAGFRPCLRCRPEVAPGTPWFGRDRYREALADAEREPGLDFGELRREAMKLTTGRLFRTGQSRSRPLRPSDELPAVNGPVAEGPTRDRVNWLAAHKNACFLPGTGGGHSVVSWMGSVGG